MTDIVERLRDEGHLQQRDGLKALLQTAADARAEIERLRAAHVRAVGSADSACEEVERQLDRIAKLEASLDTMLSWADRLSLLAHDNSADISKFRRDYNKASALLEEKKTAILDNL